MAKKHRRVRTVRRTTPRKTGQLTFTNYTTQPEEWLEFDRRDDESQLQSIFDDYESDRDTARNHIRVSLGSTYGTATQLFDEGEKRRFLDLLVDLCLQFDLLLTDASAAEWRKAARKRTKGQVNRLANKHIKAQEALADVVRTAVSYEASSDANSWTCSNLYFSLGLRIHFIQPVLHAMHTLRQAKLPRPGQPYWEHHHSLSTGEFRKESAYRLYRFLTKTGLQTSRARVTVGEISNLLWNDHVKLNGTRGRDTIAKRVAAYEATLGQKEAERSAGKRGPRKR